MFAPSDLGSLKEACLAGRWGSLARAISVVENNPPWDVPLPPVANPTPLIGITGPPGAGKSTLTAALITAYADEGKRVGVLAIDPTSPISGGAVLGDRLRMEKALTGRTNVYVRSLASRGAHGAVAPATRNVARLLELTEAFDIIIIETVGAGQTEVAIAKLADTVLLVTVPGLGDAVQAIKAGFLEIADVVVVNKADRPDAAETARHLRTNISRSIPVMQTVATDGTGVQDLREELGKRWDALVAEGEFDAHRAAKFSDEVQHIAEAWLRTSAQKLDPDPALGFGPAVALVLGEAAARWQV